MLLLLLSHFSAIPQMAAHQAPPSLGFSRQEHWSGLPFPSPMHEVKAKSLSRVQLSATPWTAAYQAPPSMGFSRQEYWSGVPFPSSSHSEIICNYSKCTLIAVLVVHFWKRRCFVFLSPALTPILKSQQMASPASVDSSCDTMIFSAFSSVQFSRSVVTP